MKTKRGTSLKEKRRRQRQGTQDEIYLNGNGVPFTMTKVKGGYRINNEF